MTDEEARKKLASLTRKREELSSKKYQLQGTLKAARERREEIRQKCRDKNIDPDKLDETIEKVRNAYHSKIEEVAKLVSEMEQKIKAFEEKRG